MCIQREQYNNKLKYALCPIIGTKVNSVCVYNYYCTNKPRLNYKMFNLTENQIVTNT